MRKLVLALLVIVALGGATLFGAVRWLAQDQLRPGAHAQAVRIEIAPGSSARSVLRRLAAMNLIKSSLRTELYARISRRPIAIRAGRYEIPPHASAADILALLGSGKVILEQLTIVEGTAFADVRRALEKHPGIVSTLAKRTDADVMTALGHGGEHPEGRFFPDTYRFAAGTTDKEVLQIAYGRMRDILEHAWAQRAENIPVKTPYEALILASIVEKETGLASERARIAGVFSARLKRGIRLQSDPTVIYGIGASYDGDIRSRDLATDTPYNTYTRAGLPPTPIALPGEESVTAAVRPDETGDLYFVAVGDGTGAHYFSKTLEEHNAAVARYLRRLRTTSEPRERAGVP